MHPVFSRRVHLAIYLACWLPGGLLLGVLVAVTGEVGWSTALALAFPLSQIYAFICLAAWYPSQAMPLTGTRVWPTVATHGLAGLLSSSVWQLVGGAWASLLGKLGPFPTAYADFAGQIPLFFSFGLLLYLLAVAASYLLLAFEASRRAEQEALEARKDQALAARELELARSLQSRLLPPGSHQEETYRLEARNLPAHFVAGDFYDYFWRPDGSLWLVVADVSGKGIGASLVMATVKAVLPLLAEDGSPAATLRALNRKLAAELAQREFVALALVVYQPATGELELVNAGLPDPYLLRPGLLPESLQVPQPRLPLGMRPEVDYGSVHARLDPGSHLFLLSDGLPEAPTAEKEPLGYEAFEALLAEGDPAEESWAEALLKRIRQATLPEQDDDWTLLLLERLG